MSNISSTSLKTINTKLRVKYETFYKEKLSNSAKLKFLSSLKLTAENTSYLNDVKNVFFRNALTRLRISNHCLLIETGRYIQPKLDRDKRTCPHCLNNEIEDETHFLFNCSLYDYNRNTFYAKIYEITKIDLTQRSEEEKIKHLFETNKSEINFYTAKYIYKNFEKRKLL